MSQILTHNMDEKICVSGKEKNNNNELVREKKKESFNIMSFKLWRHQLASCDFMM